jgi:serine protease AprX
MSASFDGSDGGRSDDWWSGTVAPTGVRLRADADAAGRGVTIAFLDSGFVRHPDLTQPRDRIRAFYDATRPEGDASKTEMPRPSDWHGTQTCVVAAGNGRLSNGLYRGIAHEADVVLVAVGDAGRIRDEDIVAGLEWVIANREEHGIRVVSISLGGDEDRLLDENRVNQLAEEAVRLGLVLVVAAGNSGCGGDHRSLPPATAPSVITVGGYEDPEESPAGALALYCSSYGLTRDGLVKPELIALANGVAAPILPGTEAFSRAEALSLSAASPDPAVREAAQEVIRMEKIVATHYQHVDGTSFAAPIVAAVVAQMLEVNPDLTPAAVKRILIETAEPIADAEAIRQGYGVLNAAAAVAAARQEAHVGAIEPFGPPRIDTGRIIFQFHDDGAHRVCVSGEFNGWNPSKGAFSRSPDGTWRLEIPAPAPGRYRYRFLVDETRWIADPSHGAKEANPYGSMDSVLVVPER